ncbi:MAG: hypothetical protein ACR2NM_10930 [Bythopirellula sp.]
MWNTPHMTMCRLLPQWNEVFFRVAQLRPRQDSIWVARGQYRVLRSQWSEALPGYARGLTNPKVHSNTLQYASLLVLLDERNRYEQLCEDLAAQLGEPPDVLSASLTAEICGLGSAQAVEPQQGVRWLEQWMDEHGARTHVLQVLGLACYRAGQYDQAVNYLEQSRNQSQESRSWGVWGLKARIWLVLAMCHQQQGRTQKAREGMETARQMVRVNGPDEGEVVQTPPMYWLQIHNLSYLTNSFRNGVSR